MFGIYGCDRVKPDFGYIDACYKEDPVNYKLQKVCDMAWPNKLQKAMVG